jgi:hypothetical protein
MGETVYESLSAYYDALSKLGYMSQDKGKSLLLLSFFNEFVYNDYRGVISREDYRVIERALNCLFGSNCLIPYPDYLKMGKLHLGEVTELAYRVKKLENTEVIKSTDLSTEDSDVTIEEEDET